MSLGGGGSHGSPEGSGLGGGGIAGGEEDLELMRGEPLGRLVSRGGPPSESSDGEPFPAEPEALSVIGEDLQGAPPSIAEREEGSLEGILSEGRLADPRQAIDPVPEIDRLDADEDPHRGRDLEHRQGALQKSRQSVDTSGIRSAGRWTRSCFPVGFTNSITQFGEVVNEGAGSSTNAAGAEESPGFIGNAFARGACFRTRCWSE